MKDIIIISGMSGSGKNIALQAFQDLNYYCLDNFPCDLVKDFLNKDYVKNEIEKILFVIDSRSYNFLDEFPKLVSYLKEDAQNNVKILFLDANNDILIGRYKQTRRKHPFSSELSTLASIEQERKYLQNVKKQCDFYLDTSWYDKNQLIDKINNTFNAPLEKMNIHFMSFGFKYGLPLDADLVIDVRFLKNPFYDEKLRPKTGLEKDVSDYVYNEDKSKEFFKNTLDYLKYLIPNYQLERKQSLTIGIGCTGGKHRSVATVEKLYSEFEKKYHCSSSHRDIGRE